MDLISYQQYMDYMMRQQAMPSLSSCRLDNIFGGILSNYPHPENPGEPKKDSVLLLLEDE